jgi:hypothetical protein
MRSHGLPDTKLLLRHTNSCAENTQPFVIPDKQNYRQAPSEYLKDTPLALTTQARHALNILKDTP